MNNAIAQVDANNWCIGCGCGIATIGNIVCWEHMYEGPSEEVGSNSIIFLLA